MKSILSLVIIFVFCFGCKKDSSFDYSSKLIGRWSWIVTCPGTNNIGCWTPDSIHPAFDIAFTSESIYNVLHNDTLKFSSGYQTFESTSSDGKYATYFIKFESGSTDRYSISGDTLLLVNSDGILTISSRYKKIK